MPGQPIRRRAAAPALLATVLLGVGAASGPAAAADRTVAVRGEIKAIALAGQVLYVARQPPGRGLAVERLVPGRPPQTVLRVRHRQDDVTLAASAEAVAIGLHDAQPDTDTEGVEALFTPSRVLVGAPGGALREVTACRRGTLAPSVAVDGTRVLWVDGGCAEPTSRPRGLGPVAVATGSVDPAVAVARAPLDRGALAFGLAASGAGTFVGVVRPSFFSGGDGEVRRVEGDRLGSAILEEQGSSLRVAGALDGGRAVVVRDDMSEDGSGASCQVETLVLSPDVPGRGVLPVGGCVDGDQAPVEVAAAADRVAAIATERRRPGFHGDDAVVSLRGDGTDRRVLARGGQRAPIGIAAAAGLVARWQPRCAGGQEVVVSDVGPATAPTRVVRLCRAEILSRTARRSGRHITVRVRCRQGCVGVVTDVTRCGPGPRRLRRFAFGPGTHRLRVRPRSASLRRGRVLLQLRVENGRSQPRVVTFPRR